VTVEDDDPFGTCPPRTVLRSRPLGQGPRLVE